MFGFEFMTGSLFMNIMFYSCFVILLVSAIDLFDRYVFQIFRKTYNNTRSGLILSVLVIFVTAFFVLGSSGARPKNKINLPVNQKQQEYNSPKEVEIITPAPRYEILEGFESLKKD